MEELRSFLRRILKSKLVLLGILVHILFLISALSPIHFMDYFFFGSSVHHCCQGLDFYQVPNGMYALMHGGSLTGSLPLGVHQYSRDFLSNFNVYHPLTTIILGFILIQFDPDTSFHLFMVIKVVVVFLTVFYIYKNFKENRFLNFGIFIFLTNFSGYNDLKISQYQFLLNISFLILLINLVKNKDRFEGAFLYFITLLIKPIGILWAPVLFIRRKFLVLFLGSLFFVISTVSFNLLHLGEYYTDNLFFHILHPVKTHGIDFMSLDALLRNGFKISSPVVLILKYIFLLLIYIFTLRKDINILKIFFLLTTYFLFFYDLVFQYDFSILGSVLCLCVILLPDFQTTISRGLIMIINLPTVFFIFRLLNFMIVKNPVLGVDPEFETWRIVSLFQLLPIIILTVIVIIPELKSIWYKKHAFI